MVAGWLHDEERLRFTFLMVAWHNLPVLVSFVVYTLCDCLPALCGRYKLHQSQTTNGAALALSAAAREMYDPQASSLPRRALFRKAVKHFAVNHFVVLPVLWFTVGYQATLRVNPAAMQLGWSGGPWTVAAHMLVCIAFEDTLFYWSHRLLHSPELYGRFHKRHHEFNIPFCLAAEYAHPVETVLGNFFPFLAGPAFLASVAGSPLGIYELCLWFVLRMVKTAEAHSNYALPCAPFSCLPRWLITAEQHDFHHSRNVGMFGSFFTFWDRICGTDAAFYRSKSREKP